MTSYPEIRFKSSWLLVGALRYDITPSFEKHNNTHMLEDDFIAEVLESYRLAWLPYEKKIMSAMCEILGLEFRQNTIDIYAAPFPWPFSDPMALPTKNTPDRTIEIIVHEIIHRLLSDNTAVDWQHDFIKQWQPLFGEEHSINTLIHIPVHAVMQAIFDDTLKEPERTMRDKECCDNEHDKDYRLAWKYVEENGYNRIISQLHRSYGIK